LPRRPRARLALYQRIWTARRLAAAPHSRDRRYAGSKPSSNATSRTIQGRAGHALRQSFDRVGRAGVAMSGEPTGLLLPMYPQYAGQRRHRPTTKCFKQLSAAAVRAVTEGRRTLLRPSRLHRSARRVGP
jgi:hypothetical protein